MKQVVLIKYGELTTKKGNRNLFIKILKNNIKEKLKGYSVKINDNRSFMVIQFNEKDHENIKNVLTKVFGIHVFYFARLINTDYDDILNNALEMLNDKKFNTFKVSVKRADKSFLYDSMEMSKKLGGHILKNINNISVDVHNPELELFVEIREDGTYLYTDKIYGLGGYPIGTQPKGLLMLSGGIDSPVAGYLAMKRGIKLECVYFEALPHTSLDAREKVLTLARKLSFYHGEVKVHVVNFTNIQESIYKNCDESYCITIMRRMMYRIMTKLLKKYNGHAIINGESIGQVASQTLTSMEVINSVTNVPVIRPLACFDKLEIMDIARKIDTYETSILPYEDCCTIFVPKHPVINPSITKSEIEESKFDYEKLIDDSINNINTIIVNYDDNEFENIL